MTTCTWKDLDIEHHIFQVQAKPGFVPKNKCKRDIPIPQALADALRGYKQQHAGSLVFGKDGKPMRHLIRVLTSRAKQAGLNPNDFYLHRFRHTFCNMHLRAGVDIATVGNWAGHADLATTAVPSGHQIEIGCDEADGGSNIWCSAGSRTQIELRSASVKIQPIAAQRSRRSSTRRLQE